MEGRKNTGNPRGKNRFRTCGGGDRKMGERTPQVNPYVREITWEQWLSERKEELSRLMGQLQEMSNRPQTTIWDIGVILREKAFLETIIDALWKDVRKLKQDNGKLTKTLEEKDKQITDVLDKIGNWIKHYQPLLDEMDKEKKQLGKVKKK